jgi:acyl dehydratase
MTGRLLEDLTVGEVHTSPEIAVTEADIIEFARRYDPQDMHTGAQAPSGAAFHGLQAGGILRRWLCDFSSIPTLLVALHCLV